MCNAGSILPNCTFCPANTFSSILNATNCSNCPHGTITLGLGATSIQNCIGCRENTYLSGSQCMPCPPNMTSAGNAVAIWECVSAPGFYGNYKTGVRQCPSNHFCRRGFGSPAACGTGTHSEPGSDACLATKGVEPILIIVVLSVWISLLLIVIIFVIRCGLLRNPDPVDIEAILDEYLLP
jgi:hypothetical protein